MKRGNACRLALWETIACALACPLICSCQPVQTLSGIEHLEHSGHGQNVQVCERPTVESLAGDLDKLEANLDKFGSVVAKQPDVWGQARLTKHREEFEQQMVAQLSAFDLTLQGSVSQSDQAYFADALALSAAASGSSPNALSSTTSSSSSSSSQQSQQTAPLPSLPSDTFAAFSNVTRTPVRNGPTLEFGKTGITVEPAVLLDQRARFLNHLHELRRINEGDDTADSPGYALNLVRIPISVLPGKLTEIGYGAEVTISATPYLSDELLPMTFRNLVMNDIVDQLAFPITQFINNPHNSDYLNDNVVGDLSELLTLLQLNNIDDFFNDPEKVKELKTLRWKPGLESLLSRPEWTWIDTLLKDGQELDIQAQNLPDTTQSPDSGTSPTASAVPSLRPEQIPPGTITCSPTAHGAGTTPHSGPAKQAATTASPGGRDAHNATADTKNRKFKSLQTDKLEVMQAYKKKPSGGMCPWASQVYANVRNQLGMSATKSRRAKLPFPPTQIPEVYGFDFGRLLLDTYRGMAKEQFIRPSTESKPVCIHLPDVQGYLQEEVSAAEKFLADPANQDLWLAFCTPGLVQAVRGHCTENLEAARSQFKNCILTKTQSTVMQSSTTAALAWAIIVESALLTDQLVLDMKESAASKGCVCPSGAWLPYFLPTPPPEARQAFNEYVRCRWPIHVFALDPAAQQQNIVDTFSGRREMQLAMSMAFVGGKLSANNMMHFARRIEYDFATIDLNGTEIGFSHGDDTFGWRFYPRFQTPDIESNATVFFRDLMWGGPSRNALLKQRRLEPGIRECYAIVIMPSFVPHATFTMSSNWFKLTNPKCKELDTTDAMRLSRLVKCIQTCAPQVVDGVCYRDGDLQRLFEKAKQLETRLPLQSAVVQIPYENTLGGFAMFNTGVTDLAPELTGWYGAEAVDPDASTTVFLVGNHFSVHHTKVIAGGQDVSTTEMLSRQVIQVTIPGKTLLVGDKNQQFVDVQVATPYGITQHLLIPAQTPSADGGAAAAGGPSANDSAWQPTSIDLAFVYAGLGIASPTSATDPRYRPPTLLLTKGTIDTNLYDQVDVVLKFDQKVGGAKVTIADNALNASKKGYVITGDKMAAAVFNSVGAYLGPETTNPATSITVSTELTFKSSQHAAPDKSGKTTNNLTVNFIKGAGGSAGKAAASP